MLYSGSQTEVWGLMPPISPLVENFVTCERGKTPFGASSFLVSGSQKCVFGPNGIMWAISSRQVPHLENLPFSLLIPVISCRLSSPMGQTRFAGCRWPYVFLAITQRMELCLFYCVVILTALGHSMFGITNHFYVIVGGVRKLICCTTSHIFFSPAVTSKECRQQFQNLLLHDFVP